MLRALTVGSAMVDIIVLVADSDVERMTMHNATSSFLLLEQGTKIEALEITDHTGGGAINAAVSIARLGHDVSTLVKIGDDRDGERIRALLERENIAVDCVIRTDALTTGTAVMVSSHDKNATIFTQRGANTLLAPDDLRRDMFSNKDLVYVTNLSNRSADCFPMIIDSGVAAGAFVAANPGIRQLTSRIGAFLDCLPKINLLALNKAEAASLVPAVCSQSDFRKQGEARALDLPPLARLGLEYGGFTMGLVSFMKQIRDLGVDALVVTDGKDGAYLGNADGVFFCPTRSVSVQGTVGAGDAFISTVCASLVEGHRADQALQRGAVNAASVVGAVDAQSGLLHAHALDEAIKSVVNELPVLRVT